MTIAEPIHNLTDSQKILLLRVDMDALRNEQTEIKHKQDYHHKILVEGNGELSIKEKVRNLEAYDNNLKFWFRTIAVALVLQTITFGTTAVVYFAKLYPLLIELSNKKP